MLYIKALERKSGGMLLNTVAAHDTFAILRPCSHSLERKLAALVLEDYKCSVEQCLIGDLSGVATHG